MLVEKLSENGLKYRCSGYDRHGKWCAVWHFTEKKALDAFKRMFGDVVSLIDPEYHPHYKDKTSDGFLRLMEYAGDRLKGNHHAQNNQ